MLATFAMFSSNKSVFCRDKASRHRRPVGVETRGWLVDLVGHMQDHIHMSSHMPRTHDAAISSQYNKIWRSEPLAHSLSVSMLSLISPGLAHWLQGVSLIRNAYGNTSSIRCSWGLFWKKNVNEIVIAGHRTLRRIILSFKVTLLTSREQRRH